MFVDLGKKTQIEFVKKAINKAGSERKLEKATGIPNSCINEYKQGKHRMNLERFRKLLAFLGLKESDFKFELISPRVFRKKGGQRAYEKSVASKRFDIIHKKMRAASSKKMKQWHKEMKKENLEEYHKLQYSRFKKIANYKFKTKRGELVRNQLELDIANKLFERSFAYDYEPFVKGQNNVYFPDFRIGNVLIECTMWKGFQKAYDLLKKIQDLSKKGFETWVVIPEELRMFYKPIEKYIIIVPELDNFLNARVAQTRVS